tara:strand:- start:72 stop:209 length:138 start_codon:yes stop_codon:yes gene_type:complete
VKFDWKTVLILSFVTLGLVMLLAYREITKPKKVVPVEYIFLNTNF